MSVRHLLSGFSASFLVILLCGLWVSDEFESATAPLIKVQTDAKRRAVRARQFEAVPGRERVVFLGDSRLASGLIPREFDRALRGRTTTVNLALPRHGVARFLYQLKDYARAYGAPDYIVLALSVEAGTRGERIDGAGMIEMMDYIIQDGFAWWPSGFGLRGVGIPEVRRLRRLRAERERAIAEMIAAQGVFWWVNKERGLPADFTAPPAGASPSEDAAWSAVQSSTFRLLDYAAAIGSQVLLVSTPAREGSGLTSGEAPASVREILQRYANVRQPLGGWQRPIYANAEFFDRGHLNERGAQHYTGDVAREFQTIFPR